MNSVRWMPRAHQELAAIWIESDSATRKRLTTQIQVIEDQLVRAPSEVGESRGPGRRLAILRDLILDLSVRELDRLVIVNAVRPKRKSSP